MFKKFLLWALSRLQLAPREKIIDRDLFLFCTGCREWVPIPRFDDDSTLLYNLYTAHDFINLEIGCHKCGTMVKLATRNLSAAEYAMMYAANMETDGEED